MSPAHLAPLVWRSLVDPEAPLEADVTVPLAGLAVAFSASYVGFVLEMARHRHRMQGFYRRMALTGSVVVALAILVLAREVLEARRPLDCRSALLVAVEQTRGWGRVTVVGDAPLLCAHRACPPESRVGAEIVYCAANRLGRRTLATPR